MKPNILDPKWVYVPAVKTNIAETFRRVREQQKAPVVVPIRKESNK